MNNRNWILLAVIMFASCGRVVDTDTRAVVSVTLKGDFTGIDSVAGVLTEAGIAGQTLSFGRQGDTLLYAAIGNVGNGPDKKVKVELFDGMLLRFIGEEGFAVEDDAPLDLTLDLLPVERLIMPAEAWNANLRLDTSGGQYTVNWSPYPDSVEFDQTLNLVYTIVYDTTTIADQYIRDYDGFRYQTRVYRENSWNGGPIPTKKTFFGLFLYSNRFRVYIKTDGCISIP